MFIFPLGNIMEQLPATITSVSEKPVYLDGIDHVKPLPHKPHPVDEFALEFYKTLDQMRLDFGDLMSYKFQADRETKADTKEVRIQLLKIKVNDYNDKVKSFFTDIEENLTKW